MLFAVTLHGLIRFSRIIYLVKIRAERLHPLAHSMSVQVCTDPLAHSMSVQVCTDPLAHSMSV